MTTACQTYPQKRIRRDNGTGIIRLRKQFPGLVLVETGRNAKGVERTPAYRGFLAEMRDADGDSHAARSPAVGVYVGKDTLRDRLVVS